MVASIMLPTEEIAMAVLLLAFFFLFLRYVKGFGLE